MTHIGDKWHISRRKLAGEVLILLCFAAWGYIINSDMHTSWLFIDDLVEWYYAQSKPLLSYVFEGGDYEHYRPVLWAMQWVEVHLIDNHLWMIIPINLGILTLTTWIMYHFMRRLGAPGPVAALIAVAFESSRFSYYSVSQLLGIIESVPLLLGLLICICLYEYMHGGRVWFFYGALVCYVTACLVHERYMVLLPMFYYAAYVRWRAGRRRGSLPVCGMSGKCGAEAGCAAPGRGDVAKAGICRTIAAENSDAEKCSAAAAKHSVAAELLSVSGIFAAVMLLRYIKIGTVVPAGTAGTMITETFSVRLFMHNALSQVAYLLGINAGPVHLCGVRWADTSLVIKAVTVVTDALVIYVLLRFAEAICEGRKKKESLVPEDEVRCEDADTTQEHHTATEIGYLSHIADAIFFLGFIIGYITASSVTIRVELRWIYASWGMCCILLAYMTAVTGRRKPELRVPVYAAACAAAVLSTACVLYYKGSYSNIYLFREQARRESLMSQTYERYGEEIYDKDIYIVGNFYQVSRFEEIHMLAPHQPLGQERCMNIIHVAWPHEVPNPADENVLVFCEDPREDAYKPCIIPVPESSMHRPKPGAQ